MIKIFCLARLQLNSAGFKFRQRIFVAHRLRDTQGPHAVLGSAFSRQARAERAHSLHKRPNFIKGLT